MVGIKMIWEGMFDPDDLEEYPLDSPVMYNLGFWKNRAGEYLPIITLTIEYINNLISFCEVRKANPYYSFKAQELIRERSLRQILGYKEKRIFIK